MAARVITAMDRLDRYQTTLTANHLTKRNLGDLYRKYNEVPARPSTSTPYDRRTLFRNLDPLHFGAHVSSNESAEKVIDHHHKQFQNIIRSKSKNSSRSVKSSSSIKKSSLKSARTKSNVHKNDSEIEDARRLTRSATFNLEHKLQTPLSETTQKQIKSLGYQTDENYVTFAGCQPQISNVSNAFTGEPRELFAVGSSCLLDIADQLSANGKVRICRNGDPLPITTQLHAESKLDSDIFQPIALSENEVDLLDIPLSWNDQFEKEDVIVKSAVAKNKPSSPKIDVERYPVKFQSLNRTRLLTRANTEGNFKVLKVVKDSLPNSRPSSVSNGKFSSLSIGTDHYQANAELDCDEICDKLVKNAKITSINLENEEARSSPLNVSPSNEQETSNMIGDYETFPDVTTCPACIQEATLKADASISHTHNVATETDDMDNHSEDNEAQLEQLYFLGPRSKSAKGKPKFKHLHSPFRPPSSEKEKHKFLQFAFPLHTPRNDRRKPIQLVNYPDPNIIHMVFDTSTRSHRNSAVTDILSEAKLSLKGSCHSARSDISSQHSDLSIQTKNSTEVESLRNSVCSRRSNTSSKLELYSTGISVEITSARSNNLPPLSIDVKVPESQTAEDEIFPVLKHSEVKNEQAVGTEGKKQKKVRIVVDM